MWKGSVGSCPVWLGAAWVSPRDSGPGPATCSAPACVSAEISASLPGEPGLGKLEPPGPTGLPSGGQPVAVGVGAAVSRRWRAFPPRSPVAAGSASTALTWTGRGVGPLPLGRDHKTVQGADQTPDPQRLDSTEGVTLHPPPAACRHSVHGAPGRVDGHRAVSPGEPSSLGTVRRGCGEDSFPARLLSRLPCSEPIRGSHDTKSWETLSVRTICLRGWMQSNR